METAEIKQIVKEAVREEFEANQGEQFLNAKEACEYLGISFPTFQKYVKEGKIPGHVFGTITRYKVSELLECSHKKFKS